MENYLCKVWSADRLTKKSFLCQPTIEQIIEKAKNNSMEGEKLVLEHDGTAVEDDDTLVRFLNEKTTLMLLNAAEVWTPSNVINVSPVAGKTITDLPVAQSLDMAFPVGQSLDIAFNTVEVCDYALSTEDEGCCEACCGCFGGLFQDD